MILLITWLNIFSATTLKLIKSAVTSGNVIFSMYTETFYCDVDLNSASKICFSWFLCVRKLVLN
eukprot:m.19626 g.19626  ORF g.19626 m.19626 type:complete len:64 (-) comp8718_c0_seq2:28-219(-)